jgi:putative transcriptional regulator
MTNNVRVERAIARLTQQELADRVGVSRQTINAMELGKYVPSTVLALKVAEVFEKNVNEIFQLEPSDRSEPSDRGE